MAYLLYLMECAKAIEGGNMEVADSLLSQIRSLTSIEPHRTTRKVVKYFAEALVRRAYGLRPRYSLPLASSANTIDYSNYILSPFYRFAEVNIKHAILDAFSAGNKNLHIVDFSVMLDPWQWSDFIEDIQHELGGGLQSVRLTSIIPKLTKKFDDIHDVRRRLIICAEGLEHINLEWRQLVANSPNDIVERFSKLRRKRKDDMLVVNWEFSLYKLLAQDGAMEQVLSKVKDLKADIMVVAEYEANLNSPNFLDRLTEAFPYYSNIFELLKESESCIKPDYRKVLWETFFRRQIGNVVACEGSDRVERVESFTQWQHRLCQAGFSPIPQPFSKLEKDLRFEEFGIEEKDGHALLCWNNCPVAAASVWKCTDLTQFCCVPITIHNAIDESEVESSSESEDDEANDHAMVDDRNKWSTEDECILLLINLRARRTPLELGFSGVDHFTKWGSSMNRIAASAKIFDMLEYICDLHKLPMAVTWISHGGETNTNSKGKRMLCIDDNACYANENVMEEYVEAYTKHHLEEGQGIAGKALQSNIHFEHDIYGLGAVDCPFVDRACRRGFHLRAAFAVRLASTYTCNEDYILEFFLPGDVEDVPGQELLIGRVLSKLQKKCKSLWNVRGRESNGPDGFEVRSHDLRMSNIPPAAVTRSSQLPLSSSVRDINEIMAVGTFSHTSDAEETHEPLEQVGEPNSTAQAAPILIDDNGSSDKQTILFTNKRRKISKVWEGFDSHEGKNGEVWATCKYCSKQYRAESTRGTTNLHKHLNKCMANRQGGAEQQPLPSVEIDYSRTDVIQGNFGLNQERSRTEIARVMMKHAYGLDKVQNESFETFVKNLQAMLHLCSQDTGEADVLAIYIQEKEKLIRYFDNLSRLFSLTIELRSSDDKMMTYCCLILHYIDDGWRLKKKILAFRNLHYHVDARTVNEVLQRVLTEWSISKKVHFILLHATPPNDHMIGELRSMLSDQVSHISEDSFCVSGYAQILIRLVQDGFFEIRSVLYKIRESIEYVNETPDTRQKFQERINILPLQDKKMVSRDVPSRWDSTFLMLESALELREAFTHLDQVDGDFKSNPSVEEWNMATVVCECLSVFHKSMSNFPSSIEEYFQSVSEVYRHLLQLKQSEHIYVCSMAERMKVKFDECWGKCSLALGFSVVLNPVFKFDLVEYGYQQIYGNDVYLHLSKFRYIFTGVYHKYANANRDLGPSSTADETCSRSYSLSFDEWRKAKYAGNMVDWQQIELRQYFEQPSAILDKDTDILAWWQANAQHFPVLSRMACDFLAIPISTIVSKSPFIEEVIRMNRVFDGAHPEIIEALICGKDLLESTSAES